ncbi:MAG: flagellar biosynthesis protein FlhA [Armatimonadetes bacterium]|nr:flagellar biosynthesis protein FlhA [Armatimonadota bacterium]
MVNTRSLNQSSKRLHRYSDIVNAVAVIAIFAILIVPLPAPILDILLTLNITAAAVVLLVTTYVTEPLQFSVFPSLLLQLTLFRLALNIASTKLILAEGSAGHVIEAFGKFVVGGNYVVGFVVFFILIVIQFAVITSGAGRVAEVAARFTLDAMPGKQMSIDADLNAGLITEEQAKIRRKTIQQEADFYGAMDGSSKFVRGDAIAAIVMIVINILGGFVIGIVFKGLDILQALQNYTLLTIGEGLATQVPALLISVGTGLIVTRSASEVSMGQEVSTQIFSQPKAMAIAAGMLALFGLIGLPALPFLSMAGIVGGMAFMLGKASKQEKAEAEAEARSRSATESSPREPENVFPLISVEPFELSVGIGLIGLADVQQGGDLLERIRAMRRQVALELGLVTPPIRVRDDLQLRPNTYAIKLRGNTVVTGELMPNHLMAMDSGFATGELEGIETKEPVFGVPAVWVPKNQREIADALGYTVFAPSEVLITHLTEVLKANAPELLTRQDVQALIDTVRQNHPAVVEELIPNLLSIGEVQKILQHLLRERVPIRDLVSILESLADNAPRTKDADQLGEAVRAALSRTICQQYVEEDGSLSVITLDPRLDQRLREAIYPGADGQTVALDPNTFSALVQSVNQQVERMATFGQVPALLCSSAVRLGLKRVLERNFPNVVVLAYNEILPRIEVRVSGTVSV